MSPLGVLSFILLVAQVAVGDAAHLFVTKPTCGTTGRTCVEGEAKCVNNNCVCDRQAGFVRGRADFRCYRENTVNCEFKGDPTLITYHKELEEFSLPCRYLATHVKTQMKDKEDNVIGSCEIKIYGFNQRSIGKIYTGGFDATAKLKFNDQGEASTSFRHYGYTSENNNLVHKAGEIGNFDKYDTGNGNFRLTNPTAGVNVFFTWDPNTNRFKYTFKGCGVEVIHVPYDIKKRHEQLQVPGLSISISKDYEPQYLSNDKVMCLAPPRDGGLSLDGIKESTLDFKQSLLSRALLANIPQNHPSVAPQCSTISNAIGSCQQFRRRMAIKSCSWMLKAVHFNKCYDKSREGTQVLALFESCVVSWCSFRPCAATINLIQKSGCDKIGKVPQLTAFLTGSMCPVLQRQVPE